MGKRRKANNVEDAGFGLGYWLVVSNTITFVFTSLLWTWLNDAISY